MRNQITNELKRLGTNQMPAVAEAIFTTGGDIPNVNVAHVVPPDAHEDPGLLRDANRTALHGLDQRAVSIVEMPLLGSSTGWSTPSSGRTGARRILHGRIRKHPHYPNRRSHRCHHR